MNYIHYDMSKSSTWILVFSGLAFLFLPGIAKFSPDPFPTLVLCSFLIFLISVSLLPQYSAALLVAWLTGNASSFFLASSSQVWMTLLIRSRASLWMTLFLFHVLSSKTAITCLNTVNYSTLETHFHARQWNLEN
jgi:hypothetical protein